MNFEKYAWMKDLESKEAMIAIEKAREQYRTNGAVVFPGFLTETCLQDCIKDTRAREDDAFTTDDTHTAYLTSKDLEKFDSHSVYNFDMRTRVASTAFDELPKDSQLASLYQNPQLLQLVSMIVQKKLFLSDDPLGCCSINVFRPGYHHSFHFDESEFSTTLMLQEASDPNSGLFQYTRPLRDTPSDLALPKVAAAIRHYDKRATCFSEPTVPPPSLDTLEFRPGTLSIFSGSRSLHRVTTIEGDQSRLVAVLTFATRPGFVNSSKVQKMFWGRASGEDHV